MNYLILFVFLVFLVNATPPPTKAPTLAPSQPPTFAPSLAPTQAPTFAPSQPPTFAPSLAPTLAPTHAPSLAPTQVPSLAPTIAPTHAPSLAPTKLPSTSPTPPTSSPTQNYTDVGGSFWTIFALYIVLMIVWVVFRFLKKNKFDDWRDIMSAIAFLGGMGCVGIAYSVCVINVNQYATVSIILFWVWVWAATLFYSFDRFSTWIGWSLSLGVIPIAVIGIISPVYGGYYSNLCVYMLWPAYMILLFVMLLVQHAFNEMPQSKVTNPRQLKGIEPSNEDRAKPQYPGVLKVFDYSVIAMCIAIIIWAGVETNLGNNFFPVDVLIGFTSLVIMTEALIGTWKSEKSAKSTV